MGGKSGGKVRVSEYSMTMHVGICASGNNLELLNLKIGEKVAWKGRMVRRNVVHIDKPDLFGGKKKEGGARGLMWFLTGDAAQTLPQALFSRLGLTRGTSPGFRGIASLFFTGSGAVSNPMSDVDLFKFPNYPSATSATGTTRGFHWCSNNPYLKTLSARVRRAPEGLDPSITLIRLPDSSEGDEQYAANGAHIIFECMCNTDWGMGESLGAMDIGSYETAAQTLYDEGFGLNMIWTRQSKIEEFIQEVLRHIQGVQYVDPTTGKHTLKLIRGDYVAADQPQINPDNANLSNFRRKIWGEVTNEIIVTWTNPETGKEETVTAQDSAAISMQGGLASDARNYHGIASQELAIRTADRDLATVVHPIGTLEAEVSRQFWASVPQGIVRVNWPEYQIENVPYRIISVTNGASDRTIKMALSEDVFAREGARYLATGGTQWTRPSTTPQPLTTFYLGTMPSMLMTSARDLEEPAQITYGDAMTALLVAPSGDGDVSYRLVVSGTNANGDPVEDEYSDLDFASVWPSLTVLAAEAVTVVPAMLGIRGTYPSAGDFVLFGTGPDGSSEIGLVQNISSAGAVTIRRGVLDTTPKNWAAGTQLFIIPRVFSAPDTTLRGAGEVASYRLRSVTSTGVLDYAAAPVISTTLTNRASLPLRPANVRIATVAFGTYTMPTGTNSVMTAWANRNRLTEASVVQGWEAANVSPEAGQATRITIRQTGSNALLHEMDVTGTGVLLNRSMFGAATDAIVRFSAVRDGLVSLQAHAIRVILN